MNNTILKLGKYFFLALILLFGTSVESFAQSGLVDWQKSDYTYFNKNASYIESGNLNDSMPKDEIDWLKKLADSMISRWPNSSVFQWDWGEAVMMNGMWKAYRVTNDETYFNYIKSYIDHYIDSNGNILVAFDVDDYINKIAPGMLLPLLYYYTSDIKYLNAANILSNYLFNNATRTESGAFSAYKYDKIQALDTLYMLCVFLVRMGWLTKQTMYFDEAMNQIFLHVEKLQNVNEKLLYHGWDEDGKLYWANSVTHLSPCFWARGNGWALLTIFEVLEYLPYDYSQRNTLIDIFKEIIAGIAVLQDEDKGLWYTVLKEEGHSGNYLETSASAMFVYAIQKGIIYGLIDDIYQENVNQGNIGLNTKIYNDANNLAVVKDISWGTSIGNYIHYISIPLKENLSWGLGAFLMVKTLFRPNRFPPSKILKINIDSLGNQIFLNWDPVVENTGGYPVKIEQYILYRSLDCSFSNSVDSIVSIVDTCYIDTSSNFLANPTNNCFYKVKAVDPIGLLSEFSDIVGEFDYELQVTPGTDFNEIAIPLIAPDISNAEELMGAISGCNSIARWNAALQGYEQYIPGISATNFDVETGYPYYVNATENTVFSLVGEIAYPTFDLITTSGTDFNEIMIPLNKTEILKASDLMADISSCNSVAKWNTTLQGYEQYIPGLSSTDFNVSPGYPYYVNVTANVSWPTAGPAKSCPDSGNEIAEINIQGSEAPHAVWGMYECSDHSSYGIPVHFIANVATRPFERLTESSPGCALQNGIWIVQCGNFSSRWKAGEDLKIIFKDENSSYCGETVIPLSYNPEDRADSIYLKRTEFMPDRYELYQNVPNPFNGQTLIKYQIAEPMHVSIKVFNLIGQEITSLVNCDMSAGYYEVKWDGRDQNHRLTPSGIYIVGMKAGNYIETRKMVFLQ